MAPSVHTGRARVNVNVGLFSFESCRDVVGCRGRNTLKVSVDVTRSGSESTKLNQRRNSIRM